MLNNGAFEPQETFSAEIIATENQDRPGCSVHSPLRAIVKVQNPYAESFRSPSSYPTPFEAYTIVSMALQSSHQSTSQQEKGSSHLLCKPGRTVVVENRWCIAFDLLKRSINALVTKQDAENPNYRNTIHETHSRTFRPQIITEPIPQNHLQQITLQRTLRHILILGKNMLMPQLEQAAHHIIKIGPGQPLVRNLLEHERVAIIVERRIRNDSVALQALRGIRHEERIPAVEMRHGRVPVADFDDVAHLPGGGGPEDADVGDVADGVVVEEVFEQGAVVVEVDVGGAGARGCDEGFEGEDVGGGAVGWETEGLDRAGRGHRARHDVLLDFVLRYVVGRSGLVGESQERSARVMASLMVVG